MARGELQQPPKDPSQATTSPPPPSPSPPDNPPQDPPQSRFRTKLHKLSTWLSTSEPSSQALRQHKKDTFLKAGISPSDKDAPSKLHAPRGEIPPSAIRPTTGPSPEEVLLKNKATADQKLKQSASASVSASVSMSGASGSIQSPSWSGYSSASSPKGSVSGPPGDDFGAGGWGSR